MLIPRAARSVCRQGAPLLLIAMLLGLGACGGDDSAQTPSAAGQGSGGARPGGPGGGGHPGGPGERNQPPTPIAVTSAILGPIASHYEATATLEAEKQAQIQARVQGVVEDLACEEGDGVAAGQVLLRIDNDEYRLRREQAAARTANLAARHDRILRMREEELASAEEYETARADLASAEADQGLAQLDVDHTAVTAPFTGKVVERLVDPGQTVAVGTPLFVLSDFDPLLGRVHVPAKEFRRIEQDQAVTLILDSDGTRLTGRITLVSPVIDPASGTIKVTVEVPDYPPDTRPGDFAKVLIVTERREDAVLVPVGALITDKGESVVFVAIDGRAERRSVETGFSDDRHTQILSGVAGGEAIVTKGHRSLKQGAPVRILEGPGAGEVTAEHGARPDGSGTDRPDSLRRRPGGAGGRGNRGGGGH